MNILVTGATGVLGRQVVRRLEQHGHTLRLFSRRPGSEQTSVGDLATGAGLVAAVAGMNVIVHCASGTESPFGSHQVDVEGTRRLVNAAAAAGVAHLVYVSIVGVDAHPYIYYRRKRAAEQVVEAGAVPWTIVRATQFHELIHHVLRSLDRLPVLVLPRGIVFQVIDSGEVADRVAAVAEGSPQGSILEIGGPAIRGFDDLARAYQASLGKRKPTLKIPLAGRTARAMRQGRHTCPDHAEGVRTWEEYLAQNRNRETEYWRRRKRVR